MKGTPEVVTFTYGCPGAVVFSRESTGYVVFSQGTPKVVAFTHIRVLDLWCYQEKLLGM